MRYDGTSLHGAVTSAIHLQGVVEGIGTPSIPEPVVLLLARLAALGTCWRANR